MTDDPYSIGDHEQGQVHYKTLKMQARPKETPRAKLIWHVYSFLNFFFNFPQIFAISKLYQSVQSLSHVQIFATP